MSLLSELFTMTFPPEVHGRASVIPTLPPRRQHLCPRACPVTALLGRGFLSEGAVTSGSADSALQVRCRAGGTRFGLRALAACPSVPAEVEVPAAPGRGGLSIPTPSRVVSKGLKGWTRGRPVLSKRQHPCRRLGPSRGQLGPCWRRA